MAEPCPHLRRQIYQCPYTRADGSQGRHLQERCLDCGANARGPGVWVGRAEVADPDALPLLPAARRRADGPRQRGLFDDA